MPENDPLFEEKLKRRLHNHEISHGRPLFDAIHAEVANRKSVQRKRFFLAAASVMLASIGLFLFTFFQSEQKQIAVASPDSVKELKGPAEISTPVEKPVKIKADNHKKESVESPAISVPEMVDFTASSRNQKHTLPDGSIVSMDKGASISYSNDFGKENRNLSLSGIAFFEVEKNKNIPFIVSTDVSKTTVTGTSFNIISLPGREEIQVVTGSVNYSAEKSTVKLKGGMEAAFIEGEMHSKDSDSPNSLSWKTGKLVFKKESISNILSDLEIFWGKKIELSNPEIGSCTFTGAFTNPDVNQVMQVIALTMDLQWEEKENSIILTGNGCK